MTRVNFVNLSAPTAHSLLTTEKEHIPRVGEWVEIDDENGHAQFYEVAQVVHSAKYNGADVFLGISQSAEEARTILHREILKRLPF